eukprot:TRINITY_DN6247_c0_g1_i3.p1 TRINITY_DN6247_c0_g1~~TRINITY_DN6247_c0_g1_i3.p1  ORF type:complete len:235 (+),score=43.83 TRINITY_DN6247_c0_g1_i3:52-756(+)
MSSEVKSKKRTREWTKEDAYERRVRRYRKSSRSRSRSKDSVNRRRSRTSRRQSSPEGGSSPAEEPQKRLSPKPTGHHGHDRRGKIEEVKKTKEEEQKQADLLASLGRPGGVYIPPFKLAMLKKKIEDKNSESYQRITWDALRKSLTGHINKVSVANIKNIIPEVFQENIVRGRGLLCQALMKAQASSPAFTNVYAALVAVINTKMPEIGELLLRRLLDQFKNCLLYTSPSPRDS